MRRVQGLPARKGEQAVGQRRSTFGRRDGPVDLGQHLVAGEGIASEIEVAEDNAQDVVEVVRHTAGELPDRLHLLGLAQLVLGGPEFGDVLNDT